MLKAGLVKELPRTPWMAAISLRFPPLTPYGWFGTTITKFVIPSRRAAGRIGLGPGRFCPIA